MRKYIRKVKFVVGDNEISKEEAKTHIRKIFEQQRSTPSTKCFKK